MSESINEIKQRIGIDYNDLSSVSITRHMEDVVAVAVDLLQTLYDTHQATVQQIADSGIYGIVPWYRSQILNFQYGHNLEVIEVDLGNGITVYRPGYATEDEEAKIVAYAAVTESLGGILCKVAKEDRTVLLTTPEREALEAYLFKIKYPGTKINVVNQPADEFTVEVDVEVNKELINTSGEKISSSSTKPVEEAILSYLNESQFGGVFNVNLFEDHIQQVAGVVNVRLKIINVVTHTLISTVVYDLSNGINQFDYVSEAGHIVIDEADLTINYE